ncbi:hypothetical protein F2Q70_00042830 [Brassica cretica]|uniref:Uncharacterized protein n=1 Tax=Brassica cretica TaxID=69181 RepID=A0A8S9KGX7_BRACR|nr:hypothetical protein F2Q70_00042830 [Brassica cretica]
MSTYLRYDDRSVDEVRRWINFLCLFKEGIETQVNKANNNSCRATIFALVKKSTRDCPHLKLQKRAPKKVVELV